MAMKVALVHRDSPRTQEGRMIGWFSHPVKGLEWDHYPVDKGFTLNRAHFNDYDAIVYEDGKLSGTFTEAGPPLFYCIGDSTLSDNHYRARCEQAEQADVLLIDWDRLERFEHLGKPVYRFSYCVNPLLYRDYGIPKSIDVGSFQGMSPARVELNQYLAQFCSARGYTFECGVYHRDEYAKMMNRCKVVVNLNRNPFTRGHRVFDAMATHTCLVTSPLPDVSDEPRMGGVDYLEYRDNGHLAQIIDGLMRTGAWRVVALAGYQRVTESHTWQKRSRQLIQILRRHSVHSTTPQTVRAS